MFFANFSTNSQSFFLFISMLLLKALILAFITLHVFSTKW